MSDPSSDSNLQLVGDHPWLGKTTYGAIDSLARPSMAAKFAVDGPAGTVVGDHQRRDGSPCCNHMTYCLFELRSITCQAKNISWLNVSLILC